MQMWAANCTAQKREYFSAPALTLHVPPTPYFSTQFVDTPSCCTHNATRNTHVSVPSHGDEKSISSVRRSVGQSEAFGGNYNSGVTIDMSACSSVQSCLKFSAISL
jgi:hypothetical protein